jgi:transcription antitermination factor NusG
MNSLSANAALHSDRTTKTNTNWYALWIRSRHERIVSEQLRLKQVEAFLPAVPRWSIWTDRRKKIYWPLFPGYCFARFNEADRLPVLTCSGVIKIVSVDGRPASIPDREVQNIRTFVAAELEHDICPLVREGSLVEVMRGPLCGVTGRLLRKSANQPRLVISVDLIARAISVEVDAADVRPY